MVPSSNFTTAPRTCVRSQSVRPSRLVPHIQTRIGIRYGCSTQDYAWFIVFSMRRGQNPNYGLIAAMSEIEKPARLCDDMPIEEFSGY